MKKMKRMLVSVVAVVMLLASTLTVCAAPSRTNDPYISGEAADRGWYVLLIDGKDEGAFDNLLNASNGEAILGLIRQFNAGEIGKETLLAGFDNILQLLEGKVAITDVMDLIPVNGGNVVDGKHVVTTVTVPGLNTNMSGVVFLHYSEVRGIWEIVTPESVNYETGEISAVFEDLSPVVVFANVNTATDNNQTTDSNSTSNTTTETTTDGEAQGTSPKTEDSYAWAMWMGAAAVLVVCGSLMVSKKRAN